MPITSLAALSAPTVGQTEVVDGKTYVFDGNGWALQYGDVFTTATQTLKNKMLVNPNSGSQILADQPVILWDADLGQNAEIILRGNRTIQLPSNLKNGNYNLVVRQDATAGRTLTFSSDYLFQAAPVQSTQVNGLDVYQFYSDGVKMYGQQTFRGTAAPAPAPAPTPAPPPAPAPAPAPVPIEAGASAATFTQPAGSTSITSKGAVSGGANCLAAIQSAIDAAAGTTTKIAWVPAGVWHWSGGLIHVHSGVKLMGAGYANATLYADDYLGCAIFLEGSNSGVQQLKLTGAASPGRESAWSRTRITAMGATNFIIQDCWLEGSPAAGISHARSNGDTGTVCSGGYVAFNTIKNTLADSIHMTNGVTNELLEFNRIDNSGDDGIAVVSYGYDAAPCTFVTARNNVILNNQSGRNMSVVGGEDIWYYNNYIEDNPHNTAGVYIAQEGSYASRPCKRVKVELNTVKNCGGTSTGHAQIMVFSDGTYSGGVPNDDIQIIRNDLISSGAKAGVNGIRYYGPQTNVKFDQNRYTGSGSAVVSTGAGTNLTTNTPYSSGAVGYTQPTTPAVPGSAVPGTMNAVEARDTFAATGASGVGQDSQVAAIFTAGNTGSWWYPAVAADRFLSPTGAAPSGFSQNGEKFGYLRDHANGAFPLSWANDPTQPPVYYAGPPVSMGIYSHPQTLSGLGGSTTGFLAVVAFRLDSGWYNTIFSDVNGPVGGASSTNNGYYLRYDGDIGRLVFSVGTGSTRVSVDYPMVEGQGATAHVVAVWQDMAAGTINMQVDNNTVVSKPCTTHAAGASAMQMFSNPFADFTFPATWEGWDHLFGQFYGGCVFRNTCLNSTQRSILINWVANQAGISLASSGPASVTKFLACYFTAWDPKYKITSVPMDFNVIYLFNAQNGGTNRGDGSWTWPFASYVTSAQIQQVRQRGQKVLLTVGGKDLGFSYTNRTQSTNCVNSIRAIVDSMGGVDGVDFNNYEAGIGTSPTEMVWIAQQLRAAYGPNFMITSPPGAINTGGAPVNGIAMASPTDLNVMGALADAGVLTYAAPQFYDWSFYNQPGSISQITKQWVARLGAERVALGLSANYSNGPSLADCTREYDAVKAMYPNIRGAYCWNAQTNLDGGNVWGSTMKPRL